MDFNKTLHEYLVPYLLEIWIWHFWRSIGTLFLFFFNIHYIGETFCPRFFSFNLTWISTKLYMNTWYQALLCVSSGILNLTFLGGKMGLCWSFHYTLYRGNMCPRLFSLTIAWISINVTWIIGIKPTCAYHLEFQIIHVLFSKT